MPRDECGHLLASLLSADPFGSLSAAIVDHGGGRAVRLEDPERGIVARASLRGPGEWSVDAWMTEWEPEDQATAALALHVLEQSPPHATSVLPASPPGLVGHSLLLFLDQACKGRDAAHLTSRAPGLALEHFGGAVPFQAEGAWNGYFFYFRYRGGRASLSVSTDTETVYNEPLWRAWEDYGDPLDGSLSSREFVDLFCRLAQRLQRAEFLYEFPLLDGVPADGASATARVRALTLEDAQAWLAAGPNAGPEGVMYSEEPLAKDGRAFPDAAPGFLILPEVSQWAN